MDTLTTIHTIVDTVDNDDSRHLDEREPYRRYR